jgi:hypothetical protein
VHFETLGSVLADIGGIYTIVVQGLLLFFGPYLTYTYLKHVSSKLKAENDQDHSLILKNLKERLTFEHIYKMEDRIKNLEEFVG